jgi:HEPN domain-containing protein
LIKKEKYELWLAEAQNDFIMGETLLAANIFNGAVFHFQQAAEKAIKSLLLYSNLQPWGHSILNLIQDYESSGQNVDPELKDNARALDQHYTASRYPDAMPDITPMDAYDESTALTLKERSQAIIDFVKDTLEVKTGDPNEDGV